MYAGGLEKGKRSRGVCRASVCVRWKVGGVGPGLQWAQLPGDKNMKHASNLGDTSFNFKHLSTVISRDVTIRSTRDTT